MRVRASEYIVIDPKEGNRIAFSSSNYNDVNLWLLEDEYTLVRGRMDIDEE